MKKLSFEILFDVFFTRYAKDKGEVKSETHQPVQKVSDELSMAVINASYTL